MQQPLLGLNEFRCRIHEAKKKAVSNIYFVIYKIYANGLN